MSRRKRIVLVVLAVVPLGLVVIAVWAVIEAWQRRGQEGRGLYW